MKRIYHSISDLIFGHFALETWENIPEPLATLIDKPYYENDYEVFWYFQHSYNEYVRLYLTSFTDKQYQHDSALYYHYCSKNEKRDVANPFYFPQNIDGDNFIYHGKKVDKTAYHSYFNEDYESLHKVFVFLQNKTSLAQILKDFKPTSRNLIEFLNPMVYALKSDEKRLNMLQHPYYAEVYSRPPSKGYAPEEIPF
jgi:hypothetical protein